MLFQLEIEADNSAFRENSGELARLLRGVADEANDGRTEGAIIDANGLRVGTFWFEDGTGVDTETD